MRQGQPLKKLSQSTPQQPARLSNTQSLLRLVLFLCIATRLYVHASISLSTVSPSSCTLCYGGSSSFNANATFGGSLAATSSLTCGDVNAVIHHTSANDPTCLQLQLQAYQYCNCTTFPTSYCAMCPSLGRGQQQSPFVPITQPNQVIFNPQWNLTCQDALFASNDSIPLAPSSSLDSPLYGPGACQRIAAWAYACGCPDTTPPPCSTCLNRHLAQATKLLPPFFQTTCQQFADVASYEGSETVCQSYYAAAPVDVVAYCGGCVIGVAVNNETSPTNGSAQTTSSNTTTTVAISTVANTGACSLCQASLQQFEPPPSSSSSSSSFAKLNDTIITLTNLRRNGTAVSTNFTCFALFQWVQYVTSPSYCQHVRAAAAAQCCEVAITAAPTPVLTNRPTSIPVSVLAQRFTISPAPTTAPSANHQHSPSSSSSSSSSSAQQSTTSAATTTRRTTAIVVATLCATLAIT